jgi:hypothetical protein
LLAKSVREQYEEIIALRLQDGVEEHTLESPEFVYVPESNININSSEVTQSHLDENASKFCDAE